MKTRKKDSADEFIAKVKAAWGGGKPVPVKEFLRQFKQTWQTDPPERVLKLLKGKKTVSFDDSLRVQGAYNDPKFMRIGNLDGVKLKAMAA